MLSDWRFTLYLLAIGLHSAVYVQYLSTLPLDIKLAGMAIKWYTQFMFGLGTGIGPAIGGWLLVRLGHSVWPVLALGSALATILVLVAVRQPGATAAAASEPDLPLADVAGSSAPPETAASE